MKKISLQEIADELDVSRITVSKVLNDKEGVSDNTRIRIAKKLVEYEYRNISQSVLKLTNEQSPVLSGERNIAVIATDPQFSDFWLKIINGISSEAATRHYNLIYNFITQDEVNDFCIPVSIEKKAVRGIIVVNLYNDIAIQMLLDTGIPIVFLDITPTMFERNIEADIVLLEGDRIIYEITQQMIMNHCKTIGFIGDINYSKTIYDRYVGFRRGCEQGGLVINPEHCFTECIDGHFYYPNELQSSLENLKEFPDAFVCANDVIAHTLVKYLKEHGMVVPTDILVSGYDNVQMSIFNDSEITTAAVDTITLGKRLAKQMFIRIQSPEKFHETIYIRPSIFYRKSTNSNNFPNK